MYGGPDYLKSQLNWATAKARPGSAFKPFALAAALKDGKSIYDTFQGDSPIEVQGQKLNNEFDRDYGDVSLLKATEQSINTAFYDLVDKQMDDGPDKVVDAAEAAGSRRPSTSRPAGTTRPPCSVRTRTRRRSTWRTPMRPSRPRASTAGAHDQERDRARTARSVVGRQNLTKQRSRPSIPTIANMVNYVLLQDVVDEGHRCRRQGDWTGRWPARPVRRVVSRSSTAGRTPECDGCKDGGDT